MYQHFNEIIHFMSIVASATSTFLYHANNMTVALLRPLKPTSEQQTRPYMYEVALFGSNNSALVVS